MSAIICPTVTPATTDPHEYRAQLERIAPFARRIQLDFTDGVFTDARCMNLIQAWWPEDVTIDIHLMYEDPVSQIETLVSLKPDLVIIHAEAVGDLLRMVQHVQKFGIKTGVALLQETTPATAHALIQAVDHVLIFSGTLGSFGGKADLELLRKVPEIKAINPRVEIGWDGGASIETVAALQAGGIDVINAGGAIQHAPDSKRAYESLVDSIK